MTLDNVKICACSHGYRDTKHFGMCDKCYSALPQIERRRVQYIAAQRRTVAAQERKARVEQQAAERAARMAEREKKRKEREKRERAEAKAADKTSAPANRNKVTAREFSRIPIHKPGERVCIDDDLEASLFRRGQSALAKCGLTRQDVALMMFNNRREWMYNNGN